MILVKGNCQYDVSMRELPVSMLVWENCQYDVGMRELSM